MRRILEVDDQAKGRRLYRGIDIYESTAGLVVREMGRPPHSVVVAKSQSAYNIFSMQIHSRSPQSGDLTVADSLPRLVLVGAAGHGRVVLDVVRSMGGYWPVGFLDDGKTVNERVGGLPVLGGIDAAGDVFAAYGVTHCVVAIGDNASRRSCVSRLSTRIPDVVFPAISHSSAIVGQDVILSPGAVVLAGAIVAVGCSVGEHALLNSGAQLDHDSVLGAFASLAPGAITGGNVHIGSGSVLCLGARVIHGLTIGENVVIGANSLVLENVPSGCVWFGSPARHVRDRKPEDRYM